MSKFLNIQTNDFDSWFDSVNLNMEFWESPVCATRFGYEAGQQSRQAEIENLQKRIDDLITSIDWHIEDCELWLSMNKNDYWKGGQLEILKAIKKRFSK